LQALAQSEEGFGRRIKQMDTFYGYNIAHIARMAV